MRPLPSIYVQDTAHETTKEAADILADALAASSGQTAPSVVEVESLAEVPIRAIIVGFPPDGFSNAREEYVIDVTPTRLHLYGIDEFDPDNPDFFDGEYDPETGTWQYVEENFMTKAGSRDAVMYFLTKYLGMIWPIPGELFKVTPTHEAMRIPVGRERRRHHARYRNLLRYSRPARSGPSGQGRDVLKFNRCFYSGFGDVAHGWRGYFDRYHPDGDPGGESAYLFGLQPDGSRGFPVSDRAKICVGETDTDSTWMAHAGTPAVQNNPLHKVAGCGMQDSHSKAIA